MQMVDKLQLLALVSDRVQAVSLEAVEPALD